VEEIMPVFSHVLVLKGGRVLAAGQKTKILTTKILSAAFTGKLKLRSKANRFSMTVRPKRDAMI